MAPIQLHIAPSANPAQHTTPLIYTGQTVKIVFQCMASACEILLTAPELPHSQLIELSRLAIEEAWRIEYKYSRYQQDNTWSHLHNQPSTQHALDSETQALLQFAYHAWQLSDGLFDITSGLLRKAWPLTNAVLPAQQDIDELLPYIGFAKLGWQPERPDTIIIPSGMELDFGGIGKEYAVDRVLNILTDYLHNTSLQYRVLVNFGGDLACKQNLSIPSPWCVGIESLVGADHSDIDLQLTQGAIATSGDTKRYIEVDGKRFGHILNPKTGWPIHSPYRSISIAATTCVQAGILATLTLLQGNKASTFVKDTGLHYWLRTERQIYTND